MSVTQLGTSQSMTLSKSSFVFKYIPYRRSWIRIWLSLTGRELRCYLVPNSISPECVLPLREFSIYRPDDSSINQTSFFVGTTSEVWLLDAEYPHEAADWISIFNTLGPTLAYSQINYQSVIANLMPNAPVIAGSYSRPPSPAPSGSVTRSISTTNSTRSQNQSPAVNIPRAPTTAAPRALPRPSSTGTGGIGPVILTETVYYTHPIIVHTPTKTREVPPAPKPAPVTTKEKAPPIPEPERIIKVLIDESANTDPEDYLEYAAVRELIAKHVKAETDPLLLRLSEISEQEKRNALEYRYQIDELKRQLAAERETSDSLRSQLDMVQQKHLKMIESHNYMKNQIHVMSKGFDECIKRHAEDLENRNQSINELQMEVGRLQDQIQAKENEIEDMKLRFQYAPTLSKEFMQTSVDEHAMDEPDFTSNGNDELTLSKLEEYSAIISASGEVKFDEGDAQNTSYNSFKVDIGLGDGDVGSFGERDVKEENEDADPDEFDESYTSKNSQHTPSEKKAVKNVYTYLPNPHTLPNYGNCISHVKEMFSAIREFEERPYNPIDFCRRLRQLSLKSKGLYEKLCEEIKISYSKIRSHQAHIGDLIQKEKVCSDQLLQARHEARILRQEKKQLETEKRNIQTQITSLEMEIKRAQPATKDETPTRSRVVRKGLNKTPSEDSVSNISFS